MNKSSNIFRTLKAKTILLNIGADRIFLPATLESFESVHFLQ